MAFPAHSPTAFGAPCWTSSRAAALISTIAQVDALRSASFLACHSPLTEIRTPTGVLNETQVFERLIRGRATEFLAVVRGEPGSGKSHLINWLKLRFDYAMHRGEIKNFRSVMVKRRSGSLRDALEQLVEQLPGFERYVDPIRSAIQDLSEDSARRQLCFHISEQLIANKEQRERKLRALHHFFQDIGPQKWLCRDGGAVHRNIRRLVSQSEIDERETLPLFAEEDFDIRDAALRRQINPEVQELADFLDDDESLRAKAVSQANDILRPALMALTKLGNHTLNHIFRGIRTELKQQGQSLAVFIEDVSTLNALDVEVVNALEEQNDPRLCRLISVLGMTQPAYARLPENMRDRIGLELSIVGSEDSSPLVSNEDYADRFVARYLNAIRLDDHNVSKIADTRRRGHDVNISACSECHMRQQCIETFGSVEIEGQEIGLFPFRKRAAHRLLNGLSNETVVRKNPRGLLTKVVEPFLRTFAEGLSKSAPNMSLMVESRRPLDMAITESRYLGGWDENAKLRLAYALWYWTGYENLAQGAAALQRLLPILGLPAFSERVGPLPFPEPPRPNPPQPPTALDPQFQKLTKLVEDWYGAGAKLKQDSLFRRDILLPFVKNGVSWSDERKPSARARERVTSADAAAIAIAEMSHKPAVGAALTFSFEKSTETAELLRIGLEFQYKGNESWNYDGGASRRRAYGKWLRRHEAEIRRRVEPENLDPKDATSAAIRFLIVAYQFSEKKPLGTDYAAIVNALCSFAPKAPTAITSALKRIADDLPDRVQRIRAFLFEELSVPQGTTGGINFTDPLPIIREISKYDDQIDLISLDERFGESFWKARFAPVTELAASSWKSFSEALQTEKRELEKLLAALTNKLSSWGSANPELSEQIQVFFDGCQAVSQALRDTREVLGHPVAEEVLRSYGLKLAAWKAAARRAREIVDGENMLSLVQFDSAVLLEANSAINTVAEAMATVELAIKRRLGAAMGGEDLSKEILETHETLKKFAKQPGG